MQPSKYPVQALYYIGRNADVLQFLISEYDFKGATIRDIGTLCDVLIAQAALMFHGDLQSFS